MGKGNDAFKKAKELDPGSVVREGEFKNALVIAKLKRKKKKKKMTKEEFKKLKELDPGSVVRESDFK